MARARKPSGRPSWIDHAVRFAFGGTITVLAALMAKRYGSGVGGLFLAFPAILPAALSLIKKKEGITAARHNSQGAIAGGAGLAGFALTLSCVAGRVSPAVALLLGTIAWCGVSAAALHAGGAWLRTRAAARRRRLGG